MSIIYFNGFTLLTKYISTKSGSMPHVLSIFLSNAVKNKSFRSYLTGNVAKMWQVPFVWVSYMFQAIRAMRWVVTTSAHEENVRKCWKSYFTERLFIVNTLYVTHIRMKRNWFCSHFLFYRKQFPISSIIVCKEDNGVTVRSVK